MLLERHADVLGPGVGRLSARVPEQAAVERDEPLKADDAEQVTEPVARQDRRDLLVAGAVRVGAAGHELVPFQAHSGRTATAGLRRR